MSKTPKRNTKSDTKAVGADKTDAQVDRLLHESAEKFGLIAPGEKIPTKFKDPLEDLLPLAKERAKDTRLQDVASQIETPPAKGKKSTAPHYHGHRERLKQRLVKSDGEALADYELLEAILFRALPRRDTKPIAKELLQRFGSFAEVLNASEGELRKIKYVKDAAIAEFSLIKAATRRLLKSDVAQRPVLTSWIKVLDHCRAAMAFEPREQFRILFLDKRNRLILDEVQQTGTIDHTPVYVREICRRALEVNATALILAHNHPSGDPTPSRGDIEMTKEIVITARGLGISVHDHIILAKEGHASFKGLGLIK